MKLVTLLFDGNVRVERRATKFELLAAYRHRVRSNDWLRVPLLMLLLANDGDALDFDPGIQS